MNQKVYHASLVPGLVQIQPSISSHDQKWVYATKDIVIAAAFLGTTGGDFTCAVGRDEKTGTAFICERFEGAFDLRYAGAKGSIYVLPGATFEEGKTQWNEEVVSNFAVKPLHEIYVDDAKEYLLTLASEGQLTLQYCPGKIAYIPEDDEDLVYRATIWYEQFGEKVIEEVRKYRPDLLSRVKQAIEEKRYKV